MKYLTKKKLCKKKLLIKEQNILHKKGSHTSYQKKGSSYMYHKFKEKLQNNYKANKKKT